MDEATVGQLSDEVCESPVLLAIVLRGPDMLIRPIHNRPGKRTLVS